MKTCSRVLQARRARRAIHNLGREQPCVRRQRPEAQQPASRRPKSAYVEAGQDFVRSSTFAVGVGSKLSCALSSRRDRALCMQVHARNDMHAHGGPGTTQRGPHRHNFTLVTIWNGFEGQRCAGGVARGGCGARDRCGWLPSFTSRALSTRRLRVPQGAELHGMPSYIFVKRQ